MHISKIKVFHDISSSSFKTVQWYHVVYIFVSVVKENHTFLLLLGFVELKRQRARDAPSKLYWAKILFRERERKLKYIYLYGMSSFYKSTYIIKNKEKKKDLGPKLSSKRIWINNYKSTYSKRMNNFDDSLSTYIFHSFCSTGFIRMRNEFKLFEENLWRFVTKRIRKTHHYFH